MGNVHPSRRALPWSKKSEEALRIDGYVTMKELAKLTGLSRTYLVEIEKEGVFKPALLGKGATLYFHKVDCLARLEEQKKLRPSATWPTQGNYNVPGKEPYVPFSGEQAAKVFEAMEQGLTEVQVVIQKHIHPKIVGVAAVEYHRLREEIILTRDRMKIINNLPLDGNFPITTADELVTLLRACAAESTCAECKKRPRKICDGCSIKVAKRFAATAD